MYLGQTAKNSAPAGNASSLTIGKVGNVFKNAYNYLFAPAEADGDVFTIPCLIEVRILLRYQSMLLRSHVVL